MARVPIKIPPPITLWRRYAISEYPLGIKLSDLDRDQLRGVSRRIPEQPISERLEQRRSTGKDFSVRHSSVMDLDPSDVPREGKYFLVSITGQYFRLGLLYTMYYTAALHIIGQQCTIVYCTVLYCTVLHCIVLYCNSTVLHCTALYCTALYCTVLHCIVLYCMALYCTALYTLHDTVCTVLYCRELYCTTVLHCTALYFTALYFTALYGTLLYCTELYFTALYCTTLYCIAMHCFSWHCSTLHCIPLYYTVCTARHHVERHSIALPCTALH